MLATHHPGAGWHVQSTVGVTVVALLIAGALYRRYRRAHPRPARPSARSPAAPPPFADPSVPLAARGGSEVVTPGAVCGVCGRRPAAELRIQRTVGLVLTARRWEIREPFCRDHGIAAARDWLKQTLLEGWFGVISFFFYNPVAIVTDLIALRRAKRIPIPEQG